uniref:J domain-containing protein n=1 Tax=Anopheles culicifacies TaxID=139723 RepID=A0A182MMR3_9DIPT
MIHPDKFAQKSEQEKAIALEWSSLINKAYRTLSKSIERGKYLLALSGVTISEENTSIDKEFLLSMMDINESVEEAQSAEQLKQIASQNSKTIDYLQKTSRQFSQAYDKRQPYETDIRVPLFVRGPAISPKTVQDSAVALIDIVPTILRLANVEPPSAIDGRPLPLNGGRKDVIERQILVEYWGEGNLETHNPQCPWSAQDRLQLCTVDAACHCQDAWNNTFNCVRHLAQDLNFIYCEFQDDQEICWGNTPEAVCAKVFQSYQTLITSFGYWFGGGVSPLREPSRHMNTSLVRVGFLGVVGTPCKNLDSSSNVTIFSRGFGAASMVELAACCVTRLRLAGGSARSPTPERLNSLTLRGTKYSM